MKTSLTAIILSALLWSGAAGAQPPRGGKFGLGILVGEPTGITGKVWFDQRHALDVGASWLFHGESFYLTVDYLFHSAPVARTASFELPLYIGVGGLLAAGRKHDAGVGVRVPLGLAFEFRSVPLELSLEVAPGVLLVPGTGFNIDGGLGLRYYF